MHSYRRTLASIASVLLGCGGPALQPDSEDGAFSGGTGAGDGTGGEGVELGSGSGGSSTESSGGPDGSCTSDVDCDDADACTIDTCVAGADAEVSIGQCEHQSAGSECGELPPAVESCEPGCADKASAVFPPATPLGPSQLPASCSSGFEMNRTKDVFTIEAPGGSAARTLEVEIATYTAPDHIRISGIDKNGVEYPLVENCSMRTATYADPTGDGCSRPPDETIRRYTVNLEAGTKSLTFDTSGACTPTYLRVLGLCDFEVTPFFPGCQFRLLP